MTVQHHPLQTDKQKFGLAKHFHGQSERSAVYGAVVLLCSVLQYMELLFCSAVYCSIWRYGSVLQCIAVYGALVLDFNSAL